MNGSVRNQLVGGGVATPTESPVAVAVPTSETAPTTHWGPTVHRGPTGYAGPTTAYMQAYGGKGKKGKGKKGKGKGKGGKGKKGKGGKGKGGKGKQKNKCSGKGGKGKKGKKHHGDCYHYGSPVYASPNAAIPTSYGHPMARVPTVAMPTIQATTAPSKAPQGGNGGLTFPIFQNNAQDRSGGNVHPTGVDTQSAPNVAVGSPTGPSVSFTAGSPAVSSPAVSSPAASPVTTTAGGPVGLSRRRSPVSVAVESPTVSSPTSYLNPPAGYPSVLGPATPAMYPVFAPANYAGDIQSLRGSGGAEDKTKREKMYESTEDTPIDTSAGGNSSGPKGTSTTNTGNIRPENYSLRAEVDSSDEESPDEEASEPHEHLDMNPQITISDHALHVLRSFTESRRPYVDEPEGKMPKLKKDGRR